MREVAPARKRPLFHDVKARQIKDPAPVMFRLKRAWSSSTTPLTIVCPTNSTVPPDRRYVFIDDCETSFSQHPADFVQHETRILRVMQHVAEQHRVEALIFDRKVPAIVRKVIDARSGAVTDVQSDDSCTEHALEMVRDETVAAADVEDVGAWRKHFGHFKRHVVSSSYFTASSHSLEATSDGCS
jgi:hypothetical protein